MTANADSFLLGSLLGLSLGAFATLIFFAWFGLLDTNPNIVVPAIEEKCATIGVEQNVASDEWFDFMETCRTYYEMLHTK